MLSLLPYQSQGVDWLASRHLALLADEMGLGKTAQTLHAIQRCEADRLRTLVICPASATGVWRSEARRWLWGLPQQDHPSWHLVIVSYDRARLDQARIAAWQPTTLIADECHYLKSPSTKRSRAILGKNGLAHGAGLRRLWALSGTPAPNHAGELWTWARAFGLTQLSFAAWNAAYCHLDRGIGRPIATRHHRIPELRRLFQPYWLRRTKTDVALQLPSIWHQVTGIELPREVPEGIDLARVAQDRELLGDLDWERIKSLAGSISTLRHYLGLQKALAFAPLLSDELEQPAKQVVFYHHRRAGDLLATACGALAVRIDGSTSQADRTAAVERFQTDPGCRVFLGQITAAGTAITLTAASRCTILEASWVPGINIQAIARLHRIGQHDNVTVRWIVGDDPLDRIVVGTMRRKAADLDSLIGGGGYEQMKEVRV